MPTLRAGQNVLCAILLLVLSTETGYGQDRTLSIPDEFWFKFHQQAIDALHLQDLRESKNLLHFRISDESFAVEVWTADGQTYEGHVVDFNWRYSEAFKSLEDKRHFYSATTKLSQEKARSIHDIFERLAVFDIPTREDIPGWESGLHGVTYSVEVATPTNYSFKTYWSPDLFKERVPHAATLVRLLEELESQLNLKDSQWRFEAGLPRVGCYEYAGLRVMCFIPEPPVEDAPFILDDFLHRHWNPAIYPHAAWSHDSEGNDRFQASVGGGFNLTDRLRMNISSSRTRVSSSRGAGSHTDFWTTLSPHLKGGWSLETAAGFAQSDRLVPLGRLSASYQQRSSAPALTLHFDRTLLDITPKLAAGSVVRSRFATHSVFGFLPRVTIAGAAGVDWIHGGGEQNLRRSFSGETGLRVTHWGGASAKFADSRYPHPGNGEYFSPAALQTLTAGGQVVLRRRVSSSFLFTAGLERARPHDAPFDPWHGVYRGHVLVHFLPRVAEGGGWDFGIKLNAYNTRNSDIASAGTGWSYFSSALFLRFTRR